jgi:phage replication-related protein YjqB (UPF0714/DUF867 family)
MENRLTAYIRNVLMPCARAVPDDQVPKINFSADDPRSTSSGYAQFIIETARRWVSAFWGKCILWMRTIFCLDELARSLNNIGSMADQECTPPRLARREFLMAIGAGVPLLAHACGESEFDEFQLRSGMNDLEDGPLDPDDQGLGKPPPDQLVTTVDVSQAVPSQSFKNNAQACSVSASLAGVMIGDQVRIARNNNDYALYTVFSRRASDESNVVRMGQNARERLGTSNTFSATLLKPVVTSGLTDAEAQAADEFVERLVDDGENDGLLVIAPHGGGIEINTDLQAETVTAALACSSWICKGWKAGGGCYDRWHITSTQLSPRSFPGLGAVANRAFAYVVAFHGMSEDGVLIGGAAPKELKQMVREAILAELSDPDIQVTIAKPGDYNSGASEESVHNWLTNGGIGGIQIEQSMKVRTEHWQEVANAVIKLYSQLI